MIKNTALVLEGGGFIGMYTAGILEVFLKNQVFFESVYAVSAGAAYGASYLSKQAGRNLEVNNFIGDKRYCSWNNLIRKGSLFSWEFMYEEIPQSLLPFDYEAVSNSKSNFYIGASNCETGQSEFLLLNKAPKKDYKTILSASGSLPFIAPIVSYQNKKLLDGGLADSIPFEYALNQGNDRAVVILTQPQSYSKQTIRFSQFIKWYYRKYPKVYEMLISRASRYNASILKLEKMEKEGKVFIIRPKKILDVSRLENKPHKTALVYHEAMAQTRDEFSALRKWIDR